MPTKLGMVFERALQAPSDPTNDGLAVEGRRRLSYKSHHECKCVRPQPLLTAKAGSDQACRPEHIMEGLTFDRATCSVALKVATGICPSSEVVSMCALLLDLRSGSFPFPFLLVPLEGPGPPRSSVSFSPPRLSLSPSPSSPPGFPLELSRAKASRYAVMI